MKALGLAFIVIMLVGCGSLLGYAQEAAVNPPAVMTQEAVAPAQEDNRLPFHKDDQWRFFFSPYVRITGANIQTTTLEKELIHKITASWPHLDPVKVLPPHTGLPSRQ